MRKVTLTIDVDGHSVSRVFGHTDINWTEEVEDMLDSVEGVDNF